MEKSPPAFNCVSDPSLDKLGGDPNPATFPPALIELMIQEDLGCLPLLAPGTEPVHS